MHLTSNVLLLFALCILHSLRPLSHLEDFLKVINNSVKLTNCNFLTKKFEEATHQRMAAIENLASGALCGIIYHLFGGQPLTIIGNCWT